MDSKIKEEKLRNYAKSVINSQRYSKEIRYLLSKLNLTEKEIVDYYVKYDMDIFAYGNEIYEPLDMRFVLHLHNLLEGSWHQDRQKVILDMVKRVNPKSIVDMGFGVPTKYIRDYVLKEKIKLTFVDMYDSAFEFSKTLLDYLDKSWTNFISFKKLDMNTHEYPGYFDLYIFQDSIEHVNNSKGYLSKIVKKSPINSKFILSLPIGPIVPVHTIEWRSEKEILNWLKKCGLRVKNSKKVFVNLKVDLFSDQKDYKSCNLILTCEKL